jgi:uncharacterized protein YacL
MVVYKGLLSVYTIVVTIAGGWASYIFTAKVFLNIRWVQSVLVAEPGSKTEIYCFVGFSIVGLLLGFLISLVTFRKVVSVIHQIETMPFLDKLAVIAGLILGLVVALLLSWPFAARLEGGMGLPLQLLASTIGIILGVAMARSAISQLGQIFPAIRSEQDGVYAVGTTKLLDANIIIDGRIAEICKTGFVEGRLLVPGFVLQEVQNMADHADDLRRARGRRGLDVLNRVRKELDVDVEVFDEYGDEDDESDSVDLRLVKLARRQVAAVITNDYNLNKIAELHGVRVLNVNELASAIKPQFIPGDELLVMLIRPGNQPRQAIGYLDDGTMVVVEQASDFIGQEVDVVVTNTLQKVTGKMIFGELKSDAGPPQPTRKASQY